MVKKCLNPPSLIITTTMFSPWPRTSKFLSRSVAPAPERPISFPLNHQVTVALGMAVAERMRNSRNVGLSSRNNVIQNNVVVYLPMQLSFIGL